MRRLAIILKAVERDPRDRYAGAAKLLEDLTHPSAVGTRHVESHRGRRGSSSRSTRRAVAVAIAAIVAGVGTLVWLGHGHSAAMNRSTVVSVQGRATGAPSLATGM